ncbi:MAG: peptide transporter permease [Proteobacteria bacterium]|nr:peptide transporter permease [Pseudomonadota bacterium]
MIWRSLLSRPLIVAGLLILLLMALASLFAGSLAPFDPGKMALMQRIQAPGIAHYFGTDEFGRDVYSRLLFAGRLSLSVGVLVAIVSIFLGTVLGVCAGYFRKLDTPLSRLIDALMAFPDILLAIALMAAFGPSLSNVVIALGVVYTPRVARVVRAVTMVQRELPFVEASRSMGAGPLWIIRVHILPNLLPPLLVQGTFIFAYAILAESALSFLGVGVPPQNPTWGNMIATGQSYFQRADWMMLFPGAAIALTVLSLQLVGDALRDALDPKLRRSV